MKKVSTTINNSLPIVKYIAYIALGVIVWYLTIVISTSKIKLPIEIQNALQKQQKSYDSTISLEEEKIKELDYQIDHVKEKTTIIKEYYHEQSKAADNYTPTQLDSFFTKRYGY